MPRHSSVWYLQLKQQQHQIEIYHQHSQIQTNYPHLPAVSTEIFLRTSAFGVKKVLVEPFTDKSERQKKFIRVKLRKKLLK